MGSDVSEKPSPDQPADPLAIVCQVLAAILARIEALEARNYQYSRELDTVLLRIRDDYHSTDH